MPNSIISTDETRAVDSFVGNAYPASKDFAVNATGNIYVATTLNGRGTGKTEISEEAKKAFAQVSVFFAALTKAMAKENKNLYDFDLSTRQKD